TPRMYPSRPVRWGPGNWAASVDQVGQPMHHVERELAVIITRNIHSRFKGLAIHGCHLRGKHGALTKHRNPPVAKTDGDAHGAALYFRPGRFACCHFPLIFRIAALRRLVSYLQQYSSILWHT